LKYTIDVLLKSGKRVFIVYPIPECSFNVPHVLALLSGRYGKASIQNLSISESDYLARANDIQVAFDALPEAKNFRSIKPAELLCEDKRCMIHKDGRSFYSDDDHLSQAGAEYLSPLFAPVFAGAN
jgi:hypothetical protein